MQYANTSCCEDQEYPGSHASAPTLLRGWVVLRQPSRHTLAPLRAQNLVPTNLHHCCEPQEGSLVPTNMGARSPHCSCALGNTPPHALGEPRFGPSVTLCHQVIVNGLRGVPLPSKTHKRMSLKVCSTPCMCCKSSQDFKALSICGPCVAWDSGLQGFVGAMRCMGLDHTSGLAGGIHCGPTDTSSLKLQGEVGGWRWLSGVRRCASLKTDSQSGSVSTSSPRHCNNLVPRHSTCQYQLLHCIPRPCSRSCPPPP